MRLAFLLLLAHGAWAQRHERALTLGRAASLRLSLAAGTLHLQAGTALQAIYGRRLAQPWMVALYLDIGVVSAPLREIRATIPAATRDFASLYVTPALRLRFLPSSRVSPWMTGGGGYSLYEQSLQRADGQSNSAPRLIHRGQLMLGGGVDVKVLR